MPRITEQVHALLRDVVRPGETVVDATAGNGHDTLFLAQLVGPEGRVIAFDCQEIAIGNTARKLAEHDWHNVSLVLGSHADLDKHLTAPVAAVTFNLGYLPGGDHARITMADSTRSAITSACRHLRPGGIITIVAYVGHPGGREEAEAVAELCEDLPKPPFTVDQQRGLSENSPRLTVIRLRGKDGTMNINLKPGRYRHFKGNEYEVIGVARHSETMEAMVVYRMVGAAASLWVRPLDMFIEHVERDDYSGPRFVSIS
ncbi:MAG: DUF1653 domain-containing protein [Gemmataceae bacterium]